MSERLDAGDEPVTLQPWFVRENKWRAARYGLDAEIIVAPDGTERLVTDACATLVTTRAGRRAARLRGRAGAVPLILDTARATSGSCVSPRQNGGSLQAVVAR